MKNLCYLLQLSLLVLTGTLAGCKKDADALKDSEATLGLAGTWRLTQRQCFCPPGPVPNETLKFTATDFAFYKGKTLVSSGTYAQTTTASSCGGTIQTPALRFAYNGTSPTLQNPAMSLNGNTLVLDYGVACDAPRETYKRVQ